MDEREFNRVLDQVKLSQSQKEAMLSRLLEPERKVVPMKKLKKITVVAVAAALMVISCAAAVVTGLDQRLLDYMGWGEQGQELLVPGVVPLDITVEDNGAALHITQVLMDRYSLVVLADFTAPEGTVLDMGHAAHWGYTRFDSTAKMPYLLDQEGREVPVNSSCGYGWKILEDSDPEDNHLTMLFQLSVPADGALNQEGAAYFGLEAGNLKAYDRENERDTILCEGDWSTWIPLPDEDIGWIQTVEDAGIQEIYLSPMTLQITLDRVLYLKQLDTQGVTLTDREGRNIPMTFLFGDSGNAVVTQTANQNYRLDELIDPALLQGGKLTLHLEDGTVDIPLDGLAPIE